MADINQKPTSDNFDKEFSLNRNSKNSPHGKLPSWIMILAGAALITGVVLAKPPVTHTSDSGTRASVNVQSAPTVVADAAGFNGVNDQKADSSEVEAFFSEQNGRAPSVVYAANHQAYNMNLQPMRVDSNGYIIPSDTEGAETGVYWIDETPYAVTLAPAESGEKADLNTESESIYSLGGQDYSVRLSPLSDEDVKSLSQNEKSGVIRMGDHNYQLIMKPLGIEEQTEGNSVSESPTEPENSTVTDSPEKPNPVEKITDTDENENNVTEKPAAAWLNDKPYSVTLSPWQERVDSENNEKDTSGAYSSNSSVPVLSVTVLDEEQPSSDKTKTVVFDIEGKKYEAKITEMEDTGLTGEQTSDPVVWADTTPFMISLASTNDNSEDSFDVILNPVPEEKLPDLMAERFGGEASDFLPVIEETPEDIVSPEHVQETPQADNEPDENWFVGMFHNIFGGSPTATPTPEVVVIAVTPTAMPVRPTQTPIIVRVEPTEVVQGPVRLDAEPGVSGNNSGKSIEDDLRDPALWDDTEGDPTPTMEVGILRQQPEPDTENTGEQQPSTEENHDETTVEPTAVPTAVRLVATVVAPTSDELPHTGMAESWNIPSMLALLAGLLLLIIGIRRLRSRE